MNTDRFMYSIHCDELSLSAPMEMPENDKCFAKSSNINNTSDVNTYV